MALRRLSFDEVSVGQELPETVKHLTRGDLVNYAGVTGDPNPIHFSDAMVKAGGLDDVIAHGMLLMGMGASVVTSWLGDPGAVTEYNVRFTGMVFVPAAEKAEVVFTAKVKSLNAEDKTGQIALVAKQDDRKIFGRAIATVQFA